MEMFCNKFEYKDLFMNKWLTLDPHIPWSSVPRTFNYVCVGQYQISQSKSAQTQDEVIFFFLFLSY